MNTTDNKLDIARTLDLHRLHLAEEPGGVRADLTGADLRGADLHGANLTTANLICANLTGVDLRGADLRGADLLGANLTTADLSGANLTNANLIGAILRGADLRGAILREAILREADLTGADLSGADATNISMVGAIIHRAILPDGLRIASLCFGGWSVTITPTETSVGCLTHPNADALSWAADSPEIMAMDPAASRWWARHRESVCAVIRDMMTEVTQ